MLELIDDKYIIEIELENNQEKKNNQKRWRNTMRTAMAAAVVFLIFGLTYILIGQSNNHKDANYNYENLFRKNVNPPVKGSELTAGGRECHYYGIQNLPDLPFDTSEYSNADADLYYDENGIPANLVLTLSNEKTGKGLSIIIEKNFILAGMDEKEAVNRNGVNVFGYERDSSSDKQRLELFFKLEGKGYYLESSGMNYEETGGILDAIIEEGISLNDFDTTKGIKANEIIKTITLKEAEELESFKERVSDLENIQGMSLENNLCDYTVTYEKDEVTSERLILPYSGGASYINADYHTGEMPDSIEDSIKPDDLSVEVVQNSANDSLSEGNHVYGLVLDCGSFYIKILADCTEEELWMFFESINVTRKSDEFDYKSLFRKNGEYKYPPQDSPVGSEALEYKINEFENLNNFPFDTSVFSEVDATMYTIPDGNGNEIPNYMTIELADEETGKKIFIIITEEYIRSLYVLDEQYSVNRKGIDIFGFEDTSGELEACFKADGRGCTIKATGMSYEEIGKILDQILENRISFKIFNIDKAATKEDKEFEALFKKNPQNRVMIVNELKSSGPIYYFFNMKNVSKLPFDTSDFPQSHAMMYCDENGTPVNLTFKVYSQNNRKSISFTLTGNGKLNYSYKLDEIAGERNGLKVYGYEEDYVGVANNRLFTLLFKLDNKGYTLQFEGMSYEEMRKVYEGIIEEGISLEIFDKADAANRDETIIDDITFEKAQTMESIFQERLPSVKSINNMEIGSSKCRYTQYINHDVLENERLQLNYLDSKKSEGDLLYDYIKLDYHIDKVIYARYDITNTIKLSELTHESVSLYSFYSGLEGNHRYSFVVDCENYYIEIDADCTEEELWTLLEGIK